MILPPLVFPALDGPSRIITKLEVKRLRELLLGTSSIISLLWSSLKESRTFGQKTFGRLAFSQYSYDFIIWSIIDGFTSLFAHCVCTCVLVCVCAWVLVGVSVSGDDE